VTIREFYNRHRGFIGGVIASLTAQVIIFISVVYLWPLYALHEARNLYKEGRIAYFQCDFYKAEKFLKSAIEESNNFAPAHAALSQLYSLRAAYCQALGKPYSKSYPALAIFHGLKAIQNNPDELEGIRALTLAISCPKVLNYSMVNKLYDEGIKKSPLDSELSYVFWVINGKKVGSHIDERPIKDAIKLNDDFIFAKLDYAQALYKTKEAEKCSLAQNILNKILNSNNDIAMAHNTLGKLDVLNMEINSATEHFKTAIKLDKNGAAPHANLGIIYRGIGEFDKAHNHLESARQIGSDKYEILLNLGITLLEKKKFREAINILEEGLKKTDDPQVQAALALAYWEVGLKEIAKYQLAKAVEQKPVYNTKKWIFDNHKVSQHAASELLEDFSIWSYRKAE